MKRTDWLIDDDGDELLGENGEYVEDESNYQEAWEAVDTVKGENPQFPTAGAGLVKRLRRRAGNSPLLDNRKKFVRDLKIELERDGQRVAGITVSEDLTVFELNIAT